MFMLYFERIMAGRCRERRYADHIYIQIYFRMHHFVVKFSKKFLRLRRQGGIEPLTKILLTFLNFGANKHAFTGIYIWQYTKYP